MDKNKVSHLAHLLLQFLKDQHGSDTISRSELMEHITSLLFAAQSLREAIDEEKPCQCEACVSHRESKQ